MGNFADCMKIIKDNEYDEQYEQYEHRYSHVTIINNIIESTKTGINKTNTQYCKNSIAHLVPQHVPFT
jgi:hypothetical protein